MYDNINLFIVRKASYLYRTERGKKLMTNPELILRLVEMLLKEKEETMKAKAQQGKAEDECRNT